MDQDQVFLGFAGPYIQSPASSFGHLFLLVAKDESVPQLLWPAYSYFAPTGDDAPFAQVAKGVVGGYSLVLDSVPFGTLLSRYRRMETRSLRLIALRMGPDEKRRLKARLEARKGAAPRYFFFQVNCASALLDDLHEAMPDIPASSGVATSPAEVVYDVMAARRAERVLVLRPLAEEYREAIGALNARDRDLFDASRAAGFRGWDTLGPEVLHARWLEWRLQEVVGMRTRQAAKALPPEFFERLVKVPFRTRHVVDTVPPDMGPHAPGRWSVGAARGREEWGVIGAFRVGLHDETDFAPWYEGAGLLEMAGVKAALGSEFRLLDLTILRQRSRPASVGARPGLLWSMTLAGGRDPALDAGPWVNQAEGGLGLGWISGDGSRWGAGADILAVSGISAGDEVLPELGARGIARVSNDRWAVHVMTEYALLGCRSGPKAEIGLRRRVWRTTAARTTARVSQDGWKAELLLDWDWSRP